MSHEHLTIVTRAEALAQGLTRYFTGKPCKHGNMAERGTSSKKCFCRDCLDERNAKLRDRYAQDENYALKKRVLANEYRADPAHRATVNAAKRRQKRKRRSDPAYAAAERESRKSYVRQYSAALSKKRLADPGLAMLLNERSKTCAKRAYAEKYGRDEEYTLKLRINAVHQANKRRRAKQAVALTPAEELQVKAIYRLRHMLTRETGIEYHVDHYIPLAKGGLHHPDNLWVIPAVENLRKSSKLPSRYAPSAQR